MNLLDIYLQNLNDYPRFKRRNKWADNFLVKTAAIFFVLILVKFMIEFAIETFK